MTDDIYKNFLHKSSELFCILKENGEFIELNHAWTKLLGHSKKELTKQSCFKFIHPDDLENTLFQLHNTKENNNSLFENRVQTKGGRYLWLQWHATREANEQILAVLHDISFYKEKEFHLEKIQETGKIGYWSVNAKDPKPNWSSGTYKIHAVPLGEEIPMDEAIDFYSDDAKEKIQQDFGKALSEGIPFDGIYRFIDREKKKKWVRSIGIPRFNKEGHIEEVHGTFQDVTTERQFERAMESIRKRLELALKASDIGVWEYNLQTGELVWDERMFRILGKNKKEFSGTYEDWKSTLHPDDLEKAEKEVNKAIESGELLDTEFRILLPDGRTRYVLAKAQVTNRGGKPSKMLGVNWDITNLREAEKLLTVEKEKAEAANLAKTNFLSHMSHEIRTPMNGIVGYLSLLEETKLTKTQKDFINIIQKSTNSLHRLLNDILDYSKIEAGQMVIRKEEIDPKKLVNSISGLFEPPAKAKGIKIKITSKIQDGYGGSFDELRLGQILSNLLGNAIKFTERGEIYLFSDYDKKEKSFTFSIKDSGVGIKKEDLKNIFSPFAQVEESIRNSTKGSGLGLSIVSKLLKLMNGKISVKSQVGKGSEFIVKIPSALIQLKTKTKAPRKENKLKDFIINKDIAILVVDDDEVSLNLMKLNLKKIGSHVFTADCGKEAIKQSKKEKLDLIFMDINMPDMTGYKATEEIRKSLKEKTPPIFALTANAFNEDKILSLERGMSGHVSKPVRLEDIIDTLLELGLGKKKA